MSTSPTLSNAAAGAQGPVDDVEVKTDTRPVIRLGFWTLIVGFGAFLAWAAWAPLDEGVIAPATVSVETRRKAIQHMQGGVIRELKVKEGDEVRQDDVLVVLDDAAMRAGMESIRQNYIAQRAMEGRLLAEIAAAPVITFHPDVMRAGDAISQQHVSVQQRLFTSRRSAQQSELAAARQAIVGLEGQLVGLKQMLESRRGQQQVQGRQLANVKQLADEGFAPRNQALQLEQAQAELTASIADLESSIQRVNSQIAQQQLVIAQREQEYLKEVSAQLAEVRREVQANQERLSAVTAELGRTQIKSPVAGQVIALAIAGPGGVVSPGQRLMDILPREASLLLDARISPQVIDRIKVGDAVEVRFSAFANSPQLVVHGKVVSLSGDAITEQMGGAVMTYYMGRIELTPEGMKALGERTVQPGMMADVLIKTGERSLLTYLMHPLVKRIAASMTEE